MWLPVCGWTWLPYEPWGWATFHYGRWHWSAGFGWYWIPTTAWGPGWVHWYSGYDYVGWAPVNYWGRPGVVKSSRALTVIHKDQLKARDISKVALSQNSIKNIGQMSLVKTRIKSLRSDSSTTLKSTYTPSTKITESENIKRVKITSPEIKKENEERDIPKTSTTLGKITNILSNKSSKRISSKRSSSKSSSSNKIKSSSIAKSKTSSKVKKSSPPKSSSRTRSVSKKVKKKK
jgi:hypothetical protein